MPTYYVTPNGTGDGLTEAAPLSLDKAGQLAADGTTIVPGCTLILLPGTYAGGTFYGRNEYVAGAHLPLRFEFREGAKIVGGNNRGHGLTFSAWNGVEVIDANIADLKVAVNGCGIWLDHCKNVHIQRPTIDNCHEFGIHTPHCKGIVIEDGTCSRSRKQHGIYIANSSSDVTIRGMRLIGNAACGLQSNGDATNYPLLESFYLPEDWTDPEGIITEDDMDSIRLFHLDWNATHPDRLIPEAAIGRYVGSIRNLLVEDCLFAFNGSAGGANWNGDSVVGATFRNNVMLPTRGKWNCISLFNSWYNPTRSQAVVIEDNQIAAGPNRANIFVFGITENNPANRLPADITVRNNLLVHVNQQMGFLELAVNEPLQHVEFSGNRISHDLVVTRNGNATLSGVGITGANTTLTAEQIATELAALPQVTDPGPGVAPGSPTPLPIGPLPPLPEDAPAAAPADVALVDTNEQGGLWLREWHAVDRFGSDYSQQAIHSPFAFDGYISPLGQHARYDPGFGLRWQGFIRPDRSGVYEFAMGSNQLHDASVAGEIVSTGGDNSHVPTTGLKAMRLESGQYYAFEFGVMTAGGYIINVMQYRREGDAAYRNIPELWFYAVKDRPGAVAPPPAPNAPTQTETWGGKVYSFGAAATGGFAVLADGAPTNGAGVRLKLSGSGLYLLNSLGNWFQRSGAGWTAVAGEPSEPPPVSTPPATPTRGIVIDSFEQLKELLRAARGN